MKPLALERDPCRLNRGRGFPRIGFSDSRCWLGLGASIDGKTLFDRPSRSCGWLGDGGSLMPGDGVAVWGERCQRCEVVSALASDGQCSAVADGRLAATLVEERTGMAAGADCREAGPDLASDDGRAGRARDAGELRCGVAVFCPRRGDVQKKACTPASRTGRTSPCGGCGGRSTRADLILAAWSSSTRLGPKPT